MTSDTNLKELVLGENGNDGKEGDRKEKDDKIDCFEFVYPITITMPDGSVFSGNEEEIWTEVKDWYEANPDSKERPDLQFLVDIIWDGEITQTINDDSEMKDARERCKERSKECFELVLPISWTMPDGSTLTINEKDDWDELKNWYEVNPDAEEKPSLNYPVDIQFEDGTTETVEDESEMEDIRKDC
jgi:hypothetical protein